MVQFFPGLPNVDAMTILRALILALAVISLGGGQAFGWKVMTSINGWIKTACIPENIKVALLF